MIYWGLGLVYAHISIVNIAAVVVVHVALQEYTWPNTSLLEFITVIQNLSPTVTFDGFISQASGPRPQVPGLMSQEFSSDYSDSIMYLCVCLIRKWMIVVGRPAHRYKTKNLHMVMLITSSLNNFSQCQTGVFYYNTWVTKDPWLITLIQTGRGMSLYWPLWLIWTL